MNYGDTLYSAMVITDNDGVEHCSGVVAYSPETYAANKINSATMGTLAKWLVVYGERAKAYFAND